MRKTAVYLVQVLQVTPDQWSLLHYMQSVESIDSLYHYSLYHTC